MESLKNGALIAIAAASLFGAACNKKDDGGSASKPTAGEKVAKIHCEGVNECKGHGGCKSAQNACAGQNGCKGQGFEEMTATDCEAKGGTVMAAK